MNWKNTDTRYGSLMISLHWIMLALVVAAYALILLREIYPRGSDPREMLKAWHFTVGVVVFGLVWLRLAVSLTQVHPRIEPRLSPLQHRLAVAVHQAIYLFMIVMPLLGWMALSAEGETALFNGITLPALMSPDAGLAETLQEWHEIVGTIGYFLIGLHAAAALYHHYLKHDDTLLRMLPRRRW